MHSFKFFLATPPQGRIKYPLKLNQVILKAMISTNAPNHSALSMMMMLMMMPLIHRAGVEREL
jgi:hypothetical protein